MKTRREQTVLGAVHEVDRFLLAADRRHRRHRPERLLARDRHVAGHAVQHRRLEEQVAAVLRCPRAASQHRRAVFHRGRDVPLGLQCRRLVVDRSHRRRIVERDPPSWSSRSTAAVELPEVRVTERPRGPGLKTAPVDGLNASNVVPSAASTPSPYHIRTCSLMGRPQYGRGRPAGRPRHRVVERQDDDCAATPASTHDCHTVGLASIHFCAA